MRAADLADDLRHGDAADVYGGIASEYLAIWRGAERRALYHAERGDLFVAYDEANDARIGIENAGVAIAAMLGAIAKQADFDRRMRLDCGSMDGEQLSLDAEPDGPFPCPGCYAFPGEAHPPYCPDAAIECEDAERDEDGPSDDESEERWARR